VVDDEEGMRNFLERTLARRCGMVQAAAKSVARSIGSAVGREIIRGVLGSILGGSRRR